MKQGDLLCVKNFSKVAARAWSNEKNVIKALGLLPTNSIAIYIADRHFDNLYIDVLSQYGICHILKSRVRKL
jgi:hypothetical protein